MKSYALVTGASAGIGKEIVELFAQDKINLILVARGESRLKKLAEDLKNKYSVDVVIHALDLSQPQSSEELFQVLKRTPLKIDYLVNNAGFGALGPFQEIDINEQVRMVNLNISSLVHLTGLIAPEMVKNKFGRILNMGSIAGFNPGAYMSTYYATKAFVNSFSQALYEEYKNKNVTVTLSCPGPTSSEFGARAGAANNSMFNNINMTAEKVAAEAYRAMMNGQRIIIHGQKNKFMILLTKLLPDFFVLRIISRLNQAAAQNN